MPSQQEVKWSQLKVGLIVIVSTVVLCALLFLMTSASGMSLFSKKIYLHTYLPNSQGLKAGAPVDLEGVTVGEVTKVVITTDDAHKKDPVYVIMRLDPKYKTSLHTDTVASLSTVGVLGDTVVDLDSKDATGPEVRDGDQIEAKLSPSIGDMIKESQGTVQQVNTILTRMNTVVEGLQQGQGTAGKFLRDPAIYDKTERTIDEVHQLIAGINAGKGSLGKLVTDDTLYNRLNDTSQQLDNIATHLNAGKGSAGKLLTDDALYNDLDSTLKHANSLLAEADSGKGALGMMTKDPAFARKLDDTVTHLNTLLTGIDNGKGTIGKLATDDALYNNFNTLVSSSNDLVGAVRKDPKKYLEIHLRVF